MIIAVEISKDTQQNELEANSLIVPLYAISSSVVLILSVVLIQ